MTPPLEAQTPEGPPDEIEESRIARRAELLPEEEAAGSDDPHAQAAQILHESDERTEHPEETGAASSQTSTPDQRPGEEEV